MPLPVVHSCPVWLPQTMTWLYNQVRHLPAEVESHVVCERVENLDQFYWPNVHSLCQASTWQRRWEGASRKLRPRRHTGWLAGVARKQHARLLHSHFGGTGWQNLSAARSAGLKHVVTFYGYDVKEDPPWRVRYASLFADADLVLCEGPHMAGRIVQLGCPERKVHVHRLGVDVRGIPFQPRRWHPGEPLQVLIAATFREKKGFPYALEALGRLRAELPLEVTIIGDAVDRPGSRAEKQRIIKALDDWGLRPHTRLLGFQPHHVLFEEAYRHHVFLSPSVTARGGDAEGGAPVSLIEMAATGMPIVSTVHCDIPQVVLHGQTGLLAPERDPDALFQHLRCLASNSGSWESMGEAGRSHVEDNFDAEKQGVALGQIYAELAG